MTRSVVQIRVEPDELERWRAAADETGLSLSELVRASVEACLAPGPVASSTTLPATTPAEARRLQRDAERSIGKAKTRARGIRGCSRARHHRTGVYCRECGSVPG